MLSRIRAGRIQPSATGRPRGAGGPDASDLPGEACRAQNPTAFLLPSFVMSTVFVQASSPVRRLVSVSRKV